MWVGETQIPAIPTALPGALAGSWIKSGAARIQTSTHTGCHCYRQQLICHTTTLGPANDIMHANIFKILKFIWNHKACTPAGGIREHLHVYLYRSKMCIFVKINYVRKTTVTHETVSLKRKPRPRTRLAYSWLVEWACFGTPPGLTPACCLLGGQKQRPWGNHQYKRKNVSISLGRENVTEGWLQPSPALSGYCKYLRSERTKDSLPTAPWHAFQLNK